eukprot:1129829-Prymnesium_polylepis.1
MLSRPRAHRRCEGKHVGKLDSTSNGGTRELSAQTIEIAQECALDALEVLNRAARLIQLLRYMGGVAARLDQVGLVLQLHLCAHLDRLIRGMAICLWDGRLAAERAEGDPLAALVPLVLQLGVDEARVGRRHEQPVAIVQVVRPCLIGWQLPIEDQHPRQ